MHIIDTPCQSQLYIQTDPLLWINIGDYVSTALTANITSSSRISSIMDRCEELEK